MLEYPRNVEEAKIIIKNSAHDDYKQHRMKVSTLRNGLITAAFAVATIGLGIANPSTLVASIPITGLAALTTALGVVAHKKGIQYVDSGEVFEGKSEEDIMNLATKYVDEYNEYKRSR